MQARALNPIEHVFTGPGSQPITFAFSYATTLDPELLRRGLDDVLRSFPLARSMLVRISAEELGLEEREAGLEFEARRSDSPPAPESCERYVVADEEIGRHLGASLSQNDVVTALLWKRHLGGVTGPAGGHDTFLTCPVDVRRLTPGLPRTYFGCALCFATASMDLEGLRAASVGELALRVKEAVHRVRGAFVPASIAALDSLRRRQGLAALRRVHLRHPSRGLIVTNLTRMPIRDVDFGSGPPRDFSTYVDIRGGAAILPAPGGVEVLVAPPGAA